MCRVAASGDCETGVCGGRGTSLASARGWGAVFLVDVTDGWHACCRSVRLLTRRTRGWGGWRSWSGLAAGGVGRECRAAVLVEWLAGGFEAGGGEAEVVGGGGSVAAGLSAVAFDFGECCVPCG